MSNITKEAKIKLLETMLRIRRFEEKVIELYPSQEMKTPVHLYIGQEAIAAGVMAHLERQDYIFSTHRNHGHVLSKGMDMKLLMAEFYGKETGCSRGKGGSMHPVAPECGIMGTSSIVAGGIALAVGTALATKLSNESRVSVAFFGDGAVDEGTFHECLNFAALKKLAVVFVCENNFYATNSPQSARQPHDNVAKRAEGYAIPGIQLDGNDVLGIYSAAKNAVENARTGLGPTLIECRTYRWRAHVGPECDWEKGCRSKEELESWMDKCPIRIFKEELIKDKLIDELGVEALHELIDKEIQAAVTFAQQSPFPKKEEVTEDVYYRK